MKRIFDLIFTVFGLILLALPLAFLAWLVRSKLGRPVFYTQMRSGFNGIPFKMVKFRTMTNECNSNGELLPDEERLTSFGRWLRSSSLDELPELWNVLKGEMSLVGPRPLLVQYLPLYSNEQARRHEVRPGVTGWAQINGRNAITWEDKFKLDVWYVENRNFKLDLKIILITIKKVFYKENVSNEVYEIMPPFLGGVESNNALLAKKIGEMK